jgi:hypothetical protein
MGIFEGDPLDGVEIDAVVVLQNTAHPGRRGDRVSANADTHAFEIGWRDFAALGIVD